ncbi:hypothetical protein SBON0708_004110 [Salmonella bongori serovar 48:i:- str. 94-0708]|uniref:hypothetical protein n=2 Tax=Salmonella bongori TaxID=54736 RepID=UPI00112F4872|nr:hypothetical protein [Salmonella bongori]EGE4660909.1 hypothetical protein [Salmonella bongori serovar 48:i:- str. 94-0708]
MQAKDLPHVAKSTYVDGGKAVTLQNGTSGLPYENIKCKYVFENCAFGFTFDINMDYMPNSTNSNKAYMLGIDIEYSGKGCYRGLSGGSGAPTVTIPSNGMSHGLRIRADICDSQQYISVARVWDSEIDMKISQATVSASQRVWTTYDTERYVQSSLADKHCRYSVVGQILSSGTLLRIGGTPYGSTGTTGQSLATDYEFDVLYQTATTKLDVINSGGNTLSNCLLVSPNFIFGTDTGIATILNAGNAVRLGNSIKARDIVSYNSFACRCIFVWCLKFWGSEPDKNHVRNHTQHRHRRDRHNKPNRWDSPLDKNIPVMISHNH